MQREQLAQRVLCFFIYCFLGWVWETCYVSFRKKKFVNRGFMKGPLLPIYGSGALCILFASEPFKGNYIMMAVAGMTMATVLEYVTGAAMEAIFRVRYWDYSNDFLNINGYVCLKSTLCWGVMTLGVVYIVHPPIAKFVEGLRENVLYMLDTVITILAVADFATSFKDAWDFRTLLIRAEKLREEMRSIQARLEALPQELAESVQENILELRERTREALLIEGTRTKEALQEKTEAFRERTALKRSQLELEMQELSARRAAFQEGLRSGYYRGIHGLLKRNPGAVWKRNPEVLEDMKKLIREHGKQKKQDGKKNGDY